MKTSEIPGVAQTGFAPAAAYDAHRPTYAKEAVEQFLKRLELVGVNGAKVADLAAGTGKFTEVLASRLEEYDIVAIEPHDGMRAELERKALPHVRVVKGTANDMAEIPDGSLACVVAAQVSQSVRVCQENHIVNLPRRFIGRSRISKHQSLLSLTCVKVCKHGISKRDSSGAATNRCFRRHLEHRRL